MTRPPTSGPGFATGQGRYGAMLPTLGAGSMIQLLAALAGLATLPVIIRSIGSSSFGVLVVVVSLAPWLTLIDGALYPTIRLLVGESRRPGQFTASPRLLSSAFRLAIKIATANFATLVLAIVVLPLVSLFGSHGIAGRGELALAIACFAVPIIASGPGGVYLGALEGVGRTVVAALLAGIGPLVALPFTLLVAALHGGLATFCLVQGLSVAVPRAGAWLYWRRRPSWGAGGEVPGGTDGFGLGLVLKMIALSVSVLVQNGIDPAIVSSNRGAGSAAAFGIATRLVNGALVPLLVVTPLISGNIAAARASGWPLGSSKRLRTLLGQASAAGAVVAAGVVLLGPPLAKLLGASRVDSPRSLYYAGALFVLVSFANMPLYLAFSGPTGIARSVRLNATLAVVNIAASIVLVRGYGPSGPIWASVATGCVAIGYWLVAWWRHPEWLGEAHGRVEG